MMANFMPSLASMDNKTLLANITGLCVLVITMIVDTLIQINTGIIISWEFVALSSVYTIMILLLLIMMISVSLQIPTSKKILESKYQAARNKISLSDQRVQNSQKSRVEKLRQRVRRCWVMSKTGNPQFVLAYNPACIASSVICQIVMVTMLIVFIMLWPLNLKNTGGSTYKWSVTLILLTQFTGVVVGSVDPISRLFSVFSYNFGVKWHRNLFMFLKVEKYWTQRLREWKQSPVLVLSSSRRSRSLIYNSKYIILSLCIGLQTVIIIFCKVIWLIYSIPLDNYYPSLKLLKDWWFSTPPIALRIEDIDEDISNLVLLINNEMKLSKRTLKRISNSMNYFLSKAEKEQNNSLLELLGKSIGFKGVEIFDSDHVHSVLPIELVNSWSLPIVTLTCIVVALPNIHKYEVESLLRHVGEGLSFTSLMEESLNGAREYVNIHDTTRILWHEVEHKRRWLDNHVTKNVFKGKTGREITKCLSEKAKEIVTKLKESTTDEELTENPPRNLIAANSMYRITQTILLGYQSYIEPITERQLFGHLEGMIVDIFSACFTNIPRVITMRCHESVIEKRESSVKVATKLLGNTTKIIEKLETLEIPSMDDEKMAYIDEWRLYLKQSIP